MVVTSVYAGLLALLFLLLSIRVVQMRIRGPGLGDGGDPRLQRRIRAQANFAEYVPLILILIAFLEMARYPGWLLHVLGATLLIARLLHGYALSFSDHFPFGRIWGTVLTFLLLAVAGGLCIYQGLRAGWILAGVDN